MKAADLLQGFSIYTTLAEEQVLKKMSTLRFLNEFTDREQVIIHNLIRKSLVIKVGSKNPRVIANDQFQ